MKKTDYTHATIIFTERPYILPRHIEKIKKLARGNVIIYDDYPLSEEQLYERGKEALIIITDVVGRYTSSVLSRWPKLKTIISPSVGLEHIDVDYCKKHTISVVNFPGYNARAVAEMAFANLISLVRWVPSAQEHVRGGGWDMNMFFGNELHGKQLGIIGAGNIGRQLIAIGLGMGMKILCNTKHPSKKRARSLGFDTFHSLSLVVKMSDFIIVAVPLTDETHHLINKTSFAQMKKNAYFINIARSRVIDQRALADVLYKKRIAGAALDVMDAEPYGIQSEDMIIQEMVNLPNVIVTPHIAANTHEAHTRLGELVVGAVKEALQNIS